MPTTAAHPMPPIALLRRPRASAVRRPRARRTRALVALLWVFSTVATFVAVEALGPRPASASPTGTMKTTAGGIGPGTPFGTAFDVSDLAIIGSKVYVADNASSVIRAFDRTTKTFSVVAGRASTGPVVPGPATATRLPAINGVAAAGPDLLLSTDRQILALKPGGTLTVVAGQATTGFGGDGGPATAASLNAPRGMVTMADGSIVFSDGYNDRVRKIAPNGIITTIAGTGDTGFSGDNGPATAATFSGLDTIARDSAGNLYVEDGARVRKVSVNGTITTVAGTGVAGGEGDGGPAVNAKILVYDVEVDAADNLLIATGPKGSVRQVTPGGTITTVAGGSGTGHAGDGGPALAAKFSSIASIAVDPAGGYVIGDSNVNGSDHWLRPVSPAGTVTSIAGGHEDALSGDGGPAGAAQLGTPEDIAVDKVGATYFTDSHTHRVRKIAPNGTITTVAGTTLAGNDGDGGPATEARLRQPSGIAIDPAGTVYVADEQNANVRRIATNGTITTVAGTGVKGFSGDGGPAKNAQLNAPHGLALDKAGNLYIADTMNDRVRQVSPNGTITTFAGTGVAGFAGDGGEANTAKLYHPEGVAVDASGRLFIADSWSHRIRKVVNGTITTAVGNGNNGAGGDGGPAVQAELGFPTDVSVDGGGALLITDEGVNLVRSVSPAGTITTLAGNALPGFTGDGGPATSATLNHPRAAAAKANGELVIADTDNHRIRSANGVAATSVRFHTVAPFRVLDSRTAVGGFNGPVAAGAANVKTLTVGGAGTVPASATAVVMNVTATQGTAGSFLTVYPAGGSVPTASNLNFGAGETIPNLVTVKLDGDGKVSFFNAVGSVHVVADVVGYFDSGIEADGLAFSGVNPVRLLDSHGAVGGFNGPVAGGTSKDLKVTNVGGVPSTATAVVLNITATDATQNSFLTAYPTGSAVPTSSTVNFGVGQTISNLVTAKVGAGGKVSIFNQLGKVHVLADVVGYYAPGASEASGRFHPMAPVRILDDRTGTGGYVTPWGSGTTRAVAVGGAFGIPASATGVVVNITATNGTQQSQLTVYPDGLGLPGTVTVNFAPGQTIPDLTMAKLGATGKVLITNKAGTVDVVADVVGYYTDL